MRKIASLILALLLVLPLYGQNFRTGQITLTNGDTISGFINNKDWIKNPNEIEFRKTPTGSIEQYSANSLKGFQIENKTHYLSCSVTVDQSEFRNTVIAKKKSVEARTTRGFFFLETLVRGSVSLHKLIDDYGKTHYFIEDGGQVQELLFKKLFNQTTSSVAVIPVYQNQLATAAGKCPELAASASRVQFKDKAMTDYVIALNKCTGSQLQYIKEVQRVTSEWFLNTGLSLSVISMKAAGSTLPVAREKFSPDVNPTISVSGVLTLPKNKRKYGIWLEAGYKGLTARSANNFKLDVHYVKSIVGFRLTEPNNRKLYFQAGFSNSFAFSHDTKALISTQGTDIDGFRMHEQGWLFGPGYAFSKRLGSELRLERSNGMSDFFSLDINLTSGYFLLWYKF